jgi:hypothetical protein
MAKRQTPGAREPGRQTGKLSVTAEARLVAQVQEIAQREQNTTSRVVDRLLRGGLAAEEAGSFLRAGAKELRDAIELMQRWPYQRRQTAENMESEQVIVGALLAGRQPEALALIHAFDAGVFVHPVHAAIWSMLRSGEVMRPGGPVDGLVAVLDGRFDAKSFPPVPFAMPNPNPSAKRAAAEYVEELIFGPHPTGYDIGRCALSVLDAYVMRHRAEPGTPLSGDLDEFADGTGVHRHAVQAAFREALDTLNLSELPSEGQASDLYARVAAELDMPLPLVKSYARSVIDELRRSLTQDE